MEFEADCDFRNEQEFWDGLNETISRECANHGAIDDALRSYLTLTSTFREKFLESDYDLDFCSDRLVTSPLFTDHTEYVRKQFVHCLLQDDDPNVLLIAASFLLADARDNEVAFEMLNQEGGFPRLVSMIAGQKQEGEEWLHRVLMQVLYEMSRIQKISLDHLATVDDNFIRGLFEIIELASDDVTDPYHYPVIQVLLVLNEQFMLSAHEPEAGPSKTPLTNKIIKVLSVHGSKYKTFGENIILLLNREDETSLQLLTLKLLYLLFTTPPTYEYFYTNDLRVLVDILIRNLLDLPEEARSLRHTYLRVLYPLLRHTQLQQPPHYKRAEIQKLLLVLMNGELDDVPQEDDSSSFRGHFEDVDETTKRLVKRCQSVEWLYDYEEVSTPLTESPIAEEPEAEAEADEASPISPTRSFRPAIPLPRKLKKRESSKSSTLTVGQYLTPQIESARTSSLSMVEVAAQKEKPGVITPSRNPSMKHGLRAAIIFNKKDKPPLPPQARRPAWGRMKRSSTDMEVSRAGRSEKAAAEKAAERITAKNVAEQIPAPSIESTAEELNQEKKVENKDNKDSSKAGEQPTGKEKKPPPAPKSRMWRGKQSREERLSSRREPGKFSSTMPSMATGGVKFEESPVDNSRSERKLGDMAPIEKTLSPEFVLSPASEDAPFVDAQEELSGGDIDNGKPAPPRSPFTVSNALKVAQAHAAEGIEETLDKVQFKTPPALPPARKGASHPPPTPPTSSHGRPTLSAYGTPRGSSHSIDTLASNSMSQSQTLPPKPSARGTYRSRSSSQSSAVPPPLPSSRPPSSRRGSRATQPDQLPLPSANSPQPSSLSNSMLASAVPPPPPSRGSQLMSDAAYAPPRPNSPKPHFPEDPILNLSPAGSMLSEQVRPSDLPTPTDEVIADDEDDHADNNNDDDDDHFPEFDDDEEDVVGDELDPYDDQKQPESPESQQSEQPRSDHPPPLPRQLSRRSTHSQIETPTMDGHVLRPPTVVLAPPSQIPIRRVPAPNLDIERSPFLSEDERSDGEKETTSP